MAFAPSPVRVTSADPLFVAFVRTKGAIVEFWDHAEGVFEPAALDPAAHVAPLSKLAASGPASAFQHFRVPMGVVEQGGEALIFKQAAPSYAGWACLSRRELIVQSEAE